ncbi:TauD/TfdA family dioxygenase [Fodinicola acaciae]|uniref:TauD/TfdA family dioxygenase n=1 Tax=Fodinicola acaciae TaxID=2681555 RepID=UPI0013D55D67|nr:TauD/TfdA family dioxygenase [Fodinicola acaciae]
MRGELLEAHPALAGFVSGDAQAGLALILGLPRPRAHDLALMVLGEILGHVVKFPNEGDYLIEIKEEPAVRSQRPGFNNSKEFFGHTDLSYAEDPPIFMCLHSITNDSGSGGISGFCDLADILPLLSAATIEELLREQFLFPAPPHYAGSGSVKCSILTEIANAPGYAIRFRRDNLRSATRQGAEAVLRLCSVIEQTTSEIFLEPQSVAIVNNRRVLHSRTAFISNEAAPRHINRLYFAPTFERNRSVV